MNEYIKYTPDGPWNLPNLLMTPEYWCDVTVVWLCSSRLPAGGAALSSSPVPKHSQVVSCVHQSPSAFTAEMLILFYSVFVNSDFPQWGVGSSISELQMTNKGINFKRVLPPRAHLALNVCQPLCVPSRDCMPQCSFHTPCLSIASVLSVLSAPRQKGSTGLCGWSSPCLLRPMLPWRYERSSSWTRASKSRRSSTPPGSTEAEAHAWATSRVSECVGVSETGFCVNPKVISLKYKEQNSLLFRVFFLMF